MEYDDLKRRAIKQDRDGEIARTALRAYPSPAALARAERESDEADYTR